MFRGKGFGFLQCFAGNNGDPQPVILGVPIIDKLCQGGDDYLTCFDFYSLIEAQASVDESYKNQQLWNQMAINGLAKSGIFSSDRAIQEYCSEIWNIEPVKIPNPI